MPAEGSGSCSPTGNRSPPETVWRIPLWSSGSVVRRRWWQRKVQQGAYFLVENRHASKAGSDPEESISQSVHFQYGSSGWLNRNLLMYGPHWSVRVSGKHYVGETDSLKYKDGQVTVRWAEVEIQWTIWCLSEVVLLWIWNESMVWLYDVQEMCQVCQLKSRDGHLVFLSLLVSHSSAYVPGGKKCTKQPDYNSVCIILHECTGFHTNWRKGSVVVGVA